jgi:hypothetical protein
MRHSLALVSLLLVALPCRAQTFTVGPITHCPHYTDGYTISLVAGTYHVEWVSGAWSPFPDDTYQGGFAWKSQVEVYVYSTATGGTIGAPASPGWYPTYAAAEGAALGLYTLTLPSNSVVAFHLMEIGNDPLRCGDNRGSVTLRLVEPLRTEQATWGAIKALYR